MAGSSSVGYNVFFTAGNQASGIVFGLLKAIAPPWVVMHAPANRTIFRRHDFGTVEYTEPSAYETDEIDEIVLANTEGTEENNIDFLRRNDGWFMMSTAVEFPPKPYELTLIHYDNENRRTYSTTKRFFFKRELAQGLPGLPEKTLKMPLGRNVFRRVSFGNIAYSHPSALTSAEIDEIIVGNIEINDENQIDFLLRYDGWFANCFLVNFPKEPYELTFIKHDNVNRVTHSARYKLKLQREVRLA